MPNFGFPFQQKQTQVPDFGFSEQAQIPAPSPPAKPAPEPEGQKGLLENIFSSVTGAAGKAAGAVGKGVSQFGKAVSTPGGSQILAQLGELFARGDPTLVAMARGAQSLAKQKQYAGIREKALAGQEPDFSLTAGLAPGEAEQIGQAAVQKRMAEQQMAVEQARETEKFEAWRKEHPETFATQQAFVKAQTAELARKPAAAKAEVIADLRARGVSAGVQKFTEDGKEKSFYFDVDEQGNVKTIDLGSTGVIPKGALEPAARARLDESSYDRAIDRANELAVQEKLGEMVIGPTGKPILSLREEEREAAVKRYKQLQQIQILGFTKKGLIENPAYMQAASFDVPQKIKAGERGATSDLTFTGNFQNGNPVYQDASEKKFELKF